MGGLDANLLEFWLQMQSLISEREKMIAENKQRELLGHSMAYSEEAFSNNAAKITDLQNQFNCFCRMAIKGGSVETFPDIPIKIYEESIVHNGANETCRHFNLKFGMLSSTDMDTLWDFYVQQSGQLKPFIFTSPRSSQQYIARFVNKSMSRTLFAYLLESVGVTLQEVEEEG